jgi:hypothetical protein
MLKTTLMGISLFIFLKVASGISTTDKNPRVSYQEVDPATFTGTLNIKVQPVDQADCKGNKATFSVEAEGGTGNIQYQWKRKRPSDETFETFGARDSIKLPVYNVGVGDEAPDGTLYQVVLTDQNNILTSMIASLTVNQITGIAPVGVAKYTMNQDEDLWFKVLTAGNTPNAFQWIKKYGSNDWRDLTDNTILTGSQSEQINFTKLSVADSGIYKIRVFFPTIDGNQCIETSAITRRINVIASIDTVPPEFINLNDEYRTFCEADPEMADWNETGNEIHLVRREFDQLHAHSPLFDLSTIHFSDNITPSAELKLHWGIFSSTIPFAPISDESGTELIDMHGQISLHPENINVDGKIPGNLIYQIIYWLEDAAGNLTPQELRHKIVVTFQSPPEILSEF